MVPNRIMPVSMRKTLAMAKLRLANMEIGTIGDSRVNSQGMNRISDRAAIAAVATMKPLENQSSCWPLSRVSSRAPKNRATSTKPTTSTFRPPASSLRRSLFRASGSSTKRLTRNSDSAPIGTLIRKHQRQDALSVIHPPRIGPKIGATMITMP